MRRPAPRRARPDGRLPLRLTVRLRLTALYAALFGVAGAALLTAAYLLVERPVRRSAPPAEADAALADLQLQLVLAGLAALVFAVAAGWWLAGRALAPLRRITETAERLDDTSLARERIGLRGPADELRDTAGALDRMLDRLDAAFDAQRRFVANASHELRTPLTVMRTEVDVTLADPDASVADLRAMGVAVREATERAERLVASLLDLARSEAGATGSDRVDLGRAARVALHDVADEARARGLRARLDIGEAVVTGERGLVERAVANLVENAVRHNREDGAILVRSGTSGEEASITVENDGPIIDPEELDDLLTPFRRGTGAARGTGAGLGLSIVHAVARAHGGAVRLAARPAGGLVATLTFPAGGPASGAGGAGAAATTGASETTSAPARTSPRPARRTPTAAG